MNIDEILQEWSYRCPKGYPTIVDGKFVSRDEVLILNGLLKENGMKQLPLPKKYTNHKNAITEAEQKDSVLFETALIVGWYELKKKPIPPTAANEQYVKLVKSPEKQHLLKGAKKALTDHPILLKGDNAQSAGTLTGELTDFWTMFGAKNATSKSDVLLGDNRVSVKAGPSQLMSGVKEESLATFYAALNDCPHIKESKEVNDVINAIETFTKGGKTVGKVRPALKLGKDKALVLANEANKKAKQKLEKLFNDDPKFATAFAKEAMSGRYKFGPSSLAFAEYVLAVDSTYTKSVLHKTQDNTYAAKIAKSMKLDIRFKTGSLKGGLYGYATVVGLHSDPTSLEKVSINEGWLSKAKSYILQGLEKIKTSLRSFVDKVIGRDNIEVAVSDKVDFM